MSLKFLFVAAFLVTEAAHADVLIEIDTTPMCGPMPSPAPTKQEDGTYKESNIVLTVCMPAERSSRKEIWTDYPERGGKYVRPYFDPSVMNPAGVAK